MADNFDFAALTKSWQQQKTPTEQLPNKTDLAQATQRQRQQKWLMYGEWLSAVVMLTTACWLVFTMPGWLGYLAAVFLTSGALSTAYIGWTVHKPILAYDNWSSSGLVQFRARACQLTLRYYLYTQLSCVAMILFSGLLWLLEWWKLAEIPTELLLFYSLVVCPLCLLMMLRLQQKKQQKATQLQELTRLADDFQRSE